MSYRFVDSWFVDSFRAAGSGWNILILLLEGCLQTCMTCTIVEFTVNNSWWWTEELSETCRVSFQNKIWEISASSWIYYIKKFVTMHGHMNVKAFLYFTLICRKRHSGQIEVQLNRSLISSFFCVCRANITILQYYSTKKGVIRDEENIIY
jgi:hypothetical protein